VGFEDEDATGFQALGSMDGGEADLGLGVVVREDAVYLFLESGYGLAVLRDYAETGVAVSNVFDTALMGFRALKDTTDFVFLLHEEVVVEVGEGGAACVIENVVDHGEQTGTDLAAAADKDAGAVAPELVEGADEGGVGAADEEVARLGTDEELLGVQGFGQAREGNGIGADGRDQTLGKCNGGGGTAPTDGERQYGGCLGGVVHPLEEIGHGLGVGASEAEDGLVHVTDRSNAIGEGKGVMLLDEVGVLALVDDEVVKGDGGT